MKSSEPISLVTAWVTGLLVVGSSVANAQTAQDVAKRAFPATVLLVMEDANGQPFSLGSGFLVRDGEIASNLHVIAGASRGYAKVVGRKRKYEIEGIVAVDAERDLVVLKVPSAGSSVLPLGRSETVEVGERVFAVGNPQGLEGTFSEGIVSSIRKVGMDKLLQITAPISPGSSGGPVLNVKGEVIGVSVATYRGGQNLNFAIPVNYLKTLLSEERTAKPMALTKAKPAQVKRSILGALGGRSTEGVDGDHFSWTSNQFLGYYTFSVRNNLREPIRNVVCLVIFYAKDGKPIETEMVIVRGPIRGNLAKRSQKHGRIEPDEVRHLTKTTEIRILDFRLAE